jgi:tetratricopeptide (TPR) repeat protein
MMHLRLAALALCLSMLAAPASAAERPDAGGWPLLAAPPGRAKVGPPRAADADAATYAKCMQLAKGDPAAAHKLAQSWQQQGGAHPAEHCLAVSLIGLKQYKDGAGRLQKLAEAMLRAPAGLRADVLAQAAQAWLLAGEPARAYSADAMALGLKPDDPDLLVDRAEAAGSAGWFDKAVADLDRVLQADPKRLDALIYRASANRQLGRLDPAMADVETALKLAPDSAPALLERGNIRSLHGEIDGARADWLRVAAIAPGTAAATAAKTNIGRVDAAARDEAAARKNAAVKSKNAKPPKAE